MIDSHQHFWKLSRDDYGWLTDDLQPIYRDYEPHDLKDTLKQFNIEKTVLVQAAATFEETLYMINLAEQHAFIAGIVGWVEMDSPAGLVQLDRLSQHPVVKSIRPMIQDIADDQWMLSDALRPSIDKLMEMGLCFDALVLPNHLPVLKTFVNRYPDLKVVIDHCAKPNIADSEFQLWADRIAEFSGLENVYCKLSGLVTEASESWKAEDLEPYVNHILNVFGPSRVMWGSDWPVVNLAASYQQWINTSDVLLSSLSIDEKEQIMGKTAASFYHL